MLAGKRLAEVLSKSILECLFSPKTNIDTCDDDFSIDRAHDGALAFVHLSMVPLEPWRRCAAYTVARARPAPSC